MRQITIRGIEPEIEQKIRQIAKNTHQFINQVIKEIIQSEFIKEKPPLSSLKLLAGGWTRKEASEFSLSIKSCEQIDERTHFRIPKRFTF
jgi:phosphopantetheinyl transferase (holo-ACP synthase)